MFSINPVGMMFSGTYGMNNLNNSYNSGGNIHQSFKKQYGVGYEDSGAMRPYAQPYPMAICPKAPDPTKEMGWFRRFLMKNFS